MSMNANELERRSSAVTLSDMEVFIYPELIYSLVLANIMSPRIWRWRDDPWFAGLERMKPYRRITRLKQYIMDHYAFNLDLDTWGLTTKEREIARFKDSVSPEALSQSNALFGYEGDKYYFDIDIRTHFGLDKYEGNIIPYWKTETVEAMDAFQFKPNYNTGAGECVSLATLYAAALFIVARIPLRDIFLMATPLHSQNFVDVDDGIITNNRRLVTKNMWFNGTALSAQARRALENERVTVVAHETGWIHVLYDEATIADEAIARFETRLQAYLRTPLTDELLGNFIRHSHDLQPCFQVRWLRHGVDHYIRAERLLSYEHGSPYRFNDGTRDKLMEEVDAEEFERAPIGGRIVLNDLEDYIRANNVDMCSQSGAEQLQAQFASTCFNAQRAMEGLCRFARVVPRLPQRADKQPQALGLPLNLDGDMTRDEVIARLESIRNENILAGMAFYAYRDLNRTEAEPFLKAAMERSPVCIEASRDWDDARVIEHVRGLPDESIYDEDGRLAQPDEVWNYGRGDGAEKAVLLANILQARKPEADVVVTVAPDRAELRVDGEAIAFTSRKGLKEQTWACSAFAPVAA